MVAGGVGMTKGDRVELHGLSRADLNGKTGVLGAEVTGRPGRLEVVLDEDVRKISIKVENLRPALR